MDAVIFYQAHYAQNISGLISKDIAALNIQTLNPWIAQLQERDFHFTLHKQSGLVRQISNSNIHGRVFADSDDIVCLIGIAIDTNKPVLECRTSPVEEHVMDVMCAMEDILNPQES
jgi:hypothetical protein